MDPVQRSQVVFIGGRSGVGKSTVALAMHERLRGADVRHAVIEGDNLDLAWPMPHVEHPHSRLAEQNLAAMWTNYLALGYQRLIYTNTASVVTIDDLTRAMGDDPRVVAVLLRAGADAVADRLGRRERAESLQLHLERSAVAAAQLDAEAGAEVVRVDTDDLSPEQVADRVLALAGWLGN